MKEYLIPIRTDEFSLAFCQATAPLCQDVQRLIWEEVLYCTEPIEAPATPIKCPKYTRVYSSVVRRNLSKEF